jgi:pyruvate dehydrogenase E1 component alpha subunit
MSDPGTYRSKEEMQICKGRDPIERMEKLLKEKYLLSDEALEAMQQQAQKRVEEAVNFATASPEPELDELTTDIFCKGYSHAVS